MTDHSNEPTPPLSRGVWVFLTSCYAGIATFVVMLLWNAFLVYILDDWDIKFGKYGTFELGVIVGFWISLCHIALTLITSPLHLLIRLPITRLWILIHGTLCSIISVIFTAVGITPEIMNSMGLEAGFGGIAGQFIVAGTLPFVLTIIAEKVWILVRSSTET